MYDQGSYLNPIHQSLLCFYLIRAYPDSATLSISHVSICFTTPFWSYRLNQNFHLQNRSAHPFKFAYLPQCFSIISKFGFKLANQNLIKYFQRTCFHFQTLIRYYYWIQSNFEQLISIQTVDFKLDDRPR